MAWSEVNRIYVTELLVLLVVDMYVLPTKTSIVSLCLHEWLFIIISSYAMLELIMPDAY